jgi:hypothetical protein
MVVRPWGGPPWVAAHIPVLLVGLSLKNLPLVLLVKNFVGAKLFTLNSERIAQIKVVKTRIRRSLLQLT